MRYGWLILLFWANEALAQSVQSRLGAQGAALGWSNVAIRSDWAGFSNPAAFIQARSFCVGTAKEVAGHLPGANRRGAFANLGFSKSSLAFNAFRFGDDVYAEQVVSASVAHQIGITQLGLRANGLQYRAEGFGVQRAMSFDFGGLIQLGPMVSVGALITNLTQASWTTGELLPTRLAVGVAVKPSERALATAEIEKDLVYTTTLRGGFEYNFRERMFFRSGFQLQPQLATAGIGYRSGVLRIDYALQYGFQLLLTHQISAHLQFQRKAKKT